MMKNIYSAIECLVLALHVVILMACNNDDDIRMKLLTYDKAEDTYIYNVVTLQTLNDVTKLDGDATVIKGGLSVRINYSSGELEWLDKGHNVAFGAVRDGSVLVPDSFDSLAMASVYYSMELSYLFFKNDIGLASNMPRRLPTYYSPNIESIDDEGNVSREIDNAFYMKISDKKRGFFVVPFRQFQWVPMALNSGILTHEYTHYIFDILVMDNINHLGDASTNFMRSVNEATADYMATVRTQDPNYMSHSVPEGLFVTPECNASKDMELSRDISDANYRKYNPMMDFLARNTEPVEYCPYEIGLFLASMLYEISIELDGKTRPPSKETLLRVGRWWLNGLEAFGGTMVDRDEFEVWDILSYFVAEIPPKAQDTACSVIKRRYSIHFDEVEAC